MLEEINKTLKIIKEGGVVLYPTDTVWGIGCDATNQSAVDKIFKIKERSVQKSMIILLDAVHWLPSYVQEVPEIAYDLIEQAEQPITIIFNAAKRLSKGVIAEDGTVGIRIVKDEFCQKLIARLRVPLVSTSANISNEQTATCFSEISTELINKVDYVVNWRQEETKKAQPSSIIKLKANGEIKIIRP